MIRSITDGTATWATEDGRGFARRLADGLLLAGQEVVWVPGPWRDPALLEWQRGGRAELKIFPVPRNGSRRVVPGRRRLDGQ